MGQQKSIWNPNDCEVEVEYFCIQFNLFAASFLLQYFWILDIVAPLATAFWFSVFPVWTQPWIARKFTS